MKAKILFAAALCLTIPVLACCGKNDETYNNFEDASDEAVQTEDGAQEKSDELTDENEQDDAENNDQNNDAENYGDNSEVTAMYITINSNRLEITLAENSSVEALIEILEQNDITYTADDYGNFEKVGNIGYTLPRNDEQITTEPGDVILYQGSNICLYYGVNTWSFTRIGKINGYTTEQLKELLCAGGGEITVTISLK